MADLCLEALSLLLTFLVDAANFCLHVDDIFLKLGVFLLNHLLEEAVTLLIIIESHLVSGVSPLLEGLTMFVVKGFFLPETSNVCLFCSDDLTGDVQSDHLCL